MAQTLLLSSRPASSSVSSSTTSLSSNYSKPVDSITYLDRCTGELLNEIDLNRILDEKRKSEKRFEAIKFYSNKILDKISIPIAIICIIVAIVYTVFFYLDHNLWYVVGSVGSIVIAGLMALHIFKNAPPIFKDNNTHSTKYIYVLKNKEGEFAFTDPQDKEWSPDTFDKDCNGLL